MFQVSIIKLGQGTHTLHCTSLEASGEGFVLKGVNGMPNRSVMLPNSDGVLFDITYHSPEVPSENTEQEGQGEETPADGEGPSPQVEPEA